MLTAHSKEIRVMPSLPESFTANARVAPGAMIGVEHKATPVAYLMRFCMAERWQQWMPFHIDRFRGSPDVQAMHPIAKLGYILLLAAQWQSPDCSLSSDPIDLAAASGLGDELWPVYSLRILRKFDKVGETLRNNVLYVEWKEAKRVFEARQASAIRTNTVRSPSRSPSRSADTITGTVTTTNTLKTNTARAEENISELISKIALAHPEALMAQWSVQDIPKAASVAVLQSVDAEVSRVGVTRTNAAEMILERTEAISRDVPREQWRFVPGIEKFMAKRAYRKEPSDFIGGKNGKDEETSIERTRRILRKLDGGDERLPAP